MSEHLDVGVRSSRLFGRGRERVTVLGRVLLQCLQLEVDHVGGLPGDLGDPAAQEGHDYPFGLALGETAPGTVTRLGCGVVVTR